MLDEGVRPKHVIVNHLMQQGYEYVLSAPAGTGFDPRFEPELTPAEMLHLGVFSGKYLTDCRDEFPDQWFDGARLCRERHPELNHFGLNASLPLSEWRRRGWIHADDPRGWFQWYCRYWMGRRIPGEDSRQVGRWRAFRLHAGQVRANCLPRGRRLPPEAASGAAQLGVRQPEDLNCDRRACAPVRSEPCRTATALASDATIERTQTIARSGVSIGETLRRRSGSDDGGSPCRMYC